MHIVTGAQMRSLDDTTIERHAPGITLMERAGQGIFNRIEREFADLDRLTVSIFLGGGNNAGDGLVVARLLLDHGARVILHYLHDPKEFSADAAKNYERLRSRRTGGEISEILLYLADWERKVMEALEESGLVVDALLGTGISKPVRENYARVIEMMNLSELPVVAVDIPSGVEADTGEILGTAVRADITVTMGLPKLGCYFFPGRERCGEVHVVDIGIPSEVIDEHNLREYVLDFELARGELPGREPTAHKFRCGSLLLIAGSKRYAGAARLAAETALRTGCGIVYLAGPESIRTAVQAAAPEIIFLSQPETTTGEILTETLGPLLEETRFDAIAAGPGMTAESEPAGLIHQLLKICEKPLMLDADGLNAFEGEFARLVEASRRMPIIISPHGGELRRLSGVEVPAVPVERIETLRGLVEGTGVTLVHKGAPTVIAHSDGHCDINAAGHSGMATAGSGDVLTGAVAGFLAQGLSAAAASRIGVWIHSRAAEIAAYDLGERGMIAGDCMRALPAAVRELEEDDRGW